MNLTPEQEQAVRERGRDVIVTAGAGSGKTAVLVERYVGLLEDHEIDQLVAVTFTDLAAAEMRGRVREAVMSRPKLARHIQHLDRAIIGTIHSLCLQMLRDNPVEAGIDPAATVLGEDEAQVALLESCREAIDAAAEAGEGPQVEAILRLGTYTTQTALPKMVAQRDEIESAFAALNGNTGEGWENNIRQLLASHIEPRIEEMRTELAAHLDWLTNMRNPEVADGLTPIAEGVAEIAGDPRGGDQQDILNRLQGLSEIGAVRGGSAKAWFAPTQQVRSALTTIRGMFEQVSPFPWNEADSDALPVLEGLQALFHNARDRYESRKRDQSALDFLDLELMAIELLDTSPRTAAAYRSRFRHVLVDEAQDLNPTQFRFLRLLTGHGEATAQDDPRPERFFVGDKKQSIYRFRRSDVKYLTRLENEIVDNRGARISLDTSFRSHDRLARALNDVMTDVFGEATAEYEAEMEPMKADRDSPGNRPFVEVLQIAREHIDPEQKPGPTASQLRRMEADAIAQRMGELTKGGYKVWDREKGNYRPATAGDIVILLRGMIHADEYERALENHGISYRSASGGNFYNRAEIIDLANLLEWLAEPDNAIALVALLRSPFFAIDDESLIALTQTRHPAPDGRPKSPDGRSILDALRDPPDGVLTDTRPFCIHAARVLDQLLRESRLATPEQLLEQALILTNYEASWTPLRGGDQVLANIRQFVGMARAMADKSVDELVEHIRLLRDDLGTRAPQAALDAGDAVRLLTIHSAKGLEFPIVFLADAGSSQSGQHGTSVLWRTEKGISLTLEQDVSEIDEGRAQPGFYGYLKELEKREDEAENKRLLYVAATRAADLLVVSGVQPTGNTPTWLGAFLEPEHRGHVVEHAPMPVDLGAIRGRSPNASFVVPPADMEEAANAPLLGRRGAIPIRSSTPATALEHGDGIRFSGKPDPLALIRGTLAHAAIEEWFKAGARPDLMELASRLGTRLSDDDLTNLVTDVDKMLDDFDRSDLAATLRDSATRAHFELPFSWAWDGVAVHGSIDLAYEAGGQWHVVDFKTDRVDKGGESERAASYLAQLGVYAGAIEAATKQRPNAGLMFLRTGTLYWAGDSDIDEALRETRRRIDGGKVSLLESDDMGDAADEPVIA